MFLQSQLYVVSLPDVVLAAVYLQNIYVAGLVYHRTVGVYGDVAALSTVRAERFISFTRWMILLGSAIGGGYIFKESYAKLFDVR